MHLPPLSPSPRLGWLTKAMARCGRHPAIEFCLIKHRAGQSGTGWINWSLYQRLHSVPSRYGIEKTRKRDLYCRALAFFRSPFPAVRCSLFVCVSICLCFLWLTAARLLKHAVAMPQIRTGLPLPSGRGISFTWFVLCKNVSSLQIYHPAGIQLNVVAFPTNVSPRWGSMACFVSI